MAAAPARRHECHVFKVDHTVNLEDQLKKEVQQLLALAELADTGYSSENNIKACKQTGIEPLLLVNAVVVLCRYVFFSLGSAVGDMTAIAVEVS